MTAATGAPQSPSQGIHMRASALRDDGLAGASNRLLGRSVTGESVLYNLALLAAAGRPLEECSALEIGCSSWVALRDLIELGIDYFGIDIRKSNIEKSIRYFGNSLPSNVRYDVRAGQDVSPERDGVFDIVFAIGLIYHLDIRDTYSILDAARRMRRGAVVVDTAVWPSERTKVDYYQINGNIYSGCTFHELQDLSIDAMEAMDHASYGDSKYSSFHFDKECLKRFLHNLGFNAALDYLYDTNAQDLWKSPGDSMFNSMDWPVMVCPGAYHEGERPCAGIFADLPERGPNRSIASADLALVIDRIHAHVLSIKAEREPCPRDIDQLAEMLPVRLLPHVLIAMIEANLPFGLLMHSLRRYLIAPVRHGSTHDRAHALIVLLTMAKCHGAAEPVWIADLVRGFLEVFFYAYRGERGRADPLDLLRTAWGIEPAPPLLALLPESTLAGTAKLWSTPADDIICDVVRQLPLAHAKNRTEYRDYYGKA